MPDITQDIINRALLGDPEAAKECTDADVVLPCPLCGGDAVITAGFVHNEKCVYCAECGRTYAFGKDESAALALYNKRYNLRTAAKELYAPKHIDCFGRNPETN
ncbi:hypothetical protein AGMMS49992_24220 [Clostridia bacterium]|nr:hypothetical protein AGMMS49992_24220 [Clostridia bacterium]